jgi:2'-5' RNA ligase
MAAMRLFVASCLPPEDRVFYDAVVGSLVARESDRLRAIPKGSAHVTLAFLGEVPESDVAAVATAIVRALEGRPAVDVQIGAPALLRARRMPRLIMAPVTAGAERVAQLSAAIVAALRVQDAFAELPAPKHAHVTLARVRPRATPHDGDRLEARLRGMAIRPRNVRLTDVQLAASTMTSDGSAYRVLRQWSL